MHFSVIRSAAAVDNVLVILLTETASSQQLLDQMVSGPQDPSIIQRFA
jgi:hypothetical protein